jgi:hypothetical protein
MQDPALESMLAGSTPRQFAMAGGLPSPRTALQGTPALLHGHQPAISRAASSASGFGGALPMLTFPTAGSAELTGALDEAGELAVV